MIKRVLIALFVCLVCFSHGQADELKFSRKSDFYKWLEKSENPKGIDSLQLQDGWSSRNSDYIPGEQFSDEDFAAVTLKFPELISLNLQLHEHLTDDSLKNLQNLPNLKNLSLRDMENITDQGLLLIPQVAPQLETLDLIGPYRKIEGSTLADVARNLPQLSRLQIHGWYSKDDQKWMQILQGIKQDRPEVQVFYRGDELAK